MFHKERFLPTSIIPHCIYLYTSIDDLILNTTANYPCGLRYEYRPNVQIGPIGLGPVLKDQRIWGFEMARLYLVTYRVLPRSGTHTG